MAYKFNNHQQKLNEQLEGLVSKPKILGYFSTDGDRNYLPDSSGLQYHKPPSTKNVYLDLNKGSDDIVLHKLVDEDKGEFHLLKWMKLYAETQKSEGRTWVTPNFVCSHGILFNIMTTPFIPKREWKICAAKWNGIIYMRYFPTDANKIVSYEIPQKYSTWWFKFKQYILSDAPDKDPDTSKPVIDCEKFRCVFQCRFGEYSVLYAATRDGLNSKTVLKDPLPLNDLKFTKLKLTRRPETYEEDEYFRKFMVLPWWIQCFLDGDENILCGFREHDGIVRNLKEYSLPEIVNMTKPFWNPVNSVRYCREILNYISKVVTEDCDETIYTFEKIPYGDIVTEKVSPESEYAFMPLSYLEATT